MQNGQATSFSSALLLLWRCSNGVFKRVSFLLAGMECYCGIMSGDAGDWIIYLPVIFANMRNNRKSKHSQFRRLSDYRHEVFFYTFHNGIIIFSLMCHYS